MADSSGKSPSTSVVAPRGGSTQAPLAASITVRGVLAGDELVAESFIRAHPEHGPGHSRSFAQLETVFGHRDLSVIALLDGRIVGYAPTVLMESRELRVLRARTIAGGSLVASGPLIDVALAAKQRADVLSALITEVRRRAKQNGAEWVRYVFPAMSGERSTLTAERPFPLLALGATMRSIPGAVIDLSASMDELFGGLSATTRNLLRRSERDGLTARALAGRAEWEAFSGAAPAAFGHRMGAERGFGAVFDTLIAPGNASIALANATVVERAGELLSCVVTCEANSTGYYFLAFNTERGLALNANRFALWHAMMSAKVRGVRWFQIGSRDFGAGKSGRISDFKQQFGGSMLLSPVAEWCERPMRVAGTRVISSLVARARRRAPQPPPAAR